VPERAPRWLRIAVTVVIALVVAWLLINDSGDETLSAAPTTTSEFVDPGPEPESGTVEGEDIQAGSTIGVSGLPAGYSDDLPPEALDVFDAIERGGPHAYRQDGSTFFNREGLLPFEDEGYYEEYTVETPGAPDRGARRLVVGARGEVFYTADHYASFIEVVDVSV